MIKTSKLAEEFTAYGSSAMTPIRDYKNDFFHKDDNKLPPLPRHDYIKQDVRDAKRMLTIKRNFSQRVNTKRPAHLELDNMREPIAKRQNSPSVNISNISVETIREAPLAANNNEAKTHFIKYLKDFYLSEKKYANEMNLATMVFREKLRTNSVFKTVILGLSHNEETLLFGNIESICQMSNDFTNDITVCLQNITKDSKAISNDIWLTLSELDKTEFCNLDVSTCFDMNFLRVKFSYSNYIKSHQNQADLLLLMKRCDPKSFESWQNHCLIETNNLKLQDILIKPLTRVHEWTLYLEKLLTYSKVVLNAKNYSILNASYVKYKNFLDAIKKELKENLDEKSYDDIISSQPNILEYNTMYSNSSALEGSDSSPTFDTSSITSSIYSNYTTTEVIGNSEGIEHSPTMPLVPNKITSLEINNQHLKENIENNNQTKTKFPKGVTFNKEDNKNGKERLLRAKTLKRSLSTLSKFKLQGIKPSHDVYSSLSNQITEFKNIQKSFVELNHTIKTTNYSSAPDTMIHNIEIWVQFLKSNDTSSNMTNLRAYDNYLGCLKQNKENIIFLELSILKKNVLEPLERIVEKCAAVKLQIHNFHKLRKEYVQYLKEKAANNQDVKHQIIAEHYEKLQQKLSLKLPKFIQLCQKCTDYILLNYHRFFLQYLATLAGGDSTIMNDIKEILLLQNGDTTSKGKHIISQFHNNCFKVKKSVEELKLQGKISTNSKTLKKLFDI